MILRIHPYGTSFKGVLDYTTDKEKAEPLSFDREDKKGAIRDMAYLAMCNTNCKKPVLHMSLSLPRGYHLSRTDWLDAAEMVVHGLGYTDNLFEVVRHDDTPHEHIHIILNRIRVDNLKVVNNSFERRRANRLAAELREKFHLPQLPLKRNPNHLSQGELAMEKRITTEKRKLLFRNGFILGGPSVKVPEYLQRQLDELDARYTKRTLKVRIEAAHAQSRTMSDFVTHLNKMGVALWVDLKKDPVDLRFGIQTHLGKPRFYVKARKLGESYTWIALQESGLEYRPERDIPTIDDQPELLFPPTPAPEVRARIMQREMDPGYVWSPERKSLDNFFDLYLAARKMGVQFRRSTSVGTVPEARPDEEQEQEEFIEDPLDFMFPEQAERAPPRRGGGRGR